MNRLERNFDRLRTSRTMGLFPYLMAGFPSMPISLELANAGLDAGVDGFEIGVPFSDPLADGATLQRVNARALAAGADLDTALDLACAIRDCSSETPVVLMSYYNPIHHRGDRQFAAGLAAAGADGVIVPDLPLEEAAELRTALANQSLALLPLLAPTSSADRIRAVAALDPAFVYCVALVGVTGARSDLSVALSDFLQRVRAVTQAPLVVGFGISQPDHVLRVAEMGGDAVIVASALADLVEHSPNPVAAMHAYLTELQAAITAGRPNLTRRIPPDDTDVIPLDQISQNAGILSEFHRSPRMGSAHLV